MVSETTSPAPAIPLRLSGEVPQAAAIGLRFVSAEDGVAVAELPWRADLVGDPATGVLAGGAVTTLLDHICGSAVFAALARERKPEEIGGIATLDLRIDYMRSAAPRRTLIARAHCYKITRSIAFVRAAAFEDSEDDPVATVQAAFALNTARAAS